MGTIKSKDASGSPCNNANDFDKVNYLTDKMIKDPHYLYIMRYPDFHHKKPANLLPQIAIQSSEVRRKPPSTIYTILPSGMFLIA